MPAHHRLSIRNPLVRAVILAATLVFVISLALRSQALDMSSQFLAGSTASSSHAVANGPQTPLDDATGKPVGVETPSESKADVDAAPKTTHVQNCEIDVGRLAEIKEKYDLEDNFQYLKRYVRFTRVPGLARKSVTRVDQKFLTKKFRTLNLASKKREVSAPTGAKMKRSQSPELCAPPLEVEVPASGFPATANASDFMFAVSTTYKRFNDSRTTSVREWAYWLTDGHGHSNGGKLLLLLLDASDEEIADATQRLTRLGIDVDVYHSDASMEMAVRYLTLVPTLYSHPERKNKKWLVTCDDDTYFPSMHALVEKFSTFDHDEMLYIGTLSEDVNALDRHGSQAFGGAGVFLSVPLAAKLTRMYQSCKTEEKIRESNSGWGPQGDILLRKCIYENTEVRLTTVWDLWQLDLYGDPSGFYESGIKPLSVHHFKGGGWHLAHPWETSKIAHTCGEDCTMMRFRTADDFIFSAGYSVAHYPKGIDFNLAQMERTFSAAPEDKGWNLDFMFGPQRQSLHKTGRKIAWEIQEAAVNDDGSVSQVYTRRKDDWRWVDAEGDPMSRYDGIIELVWIPA